MIIIIQSQGKLTLPLSIVNRCPRPTSASAEHESGVGTAEAEAVRQRDIHPGLTRLSGDEERDTSWRRTV